MAIKIFIVVRRKLILSGGHFGGFWKLLHRMQRTNRRSSTRTSSKKGTPLEVAIIGGGCASIAAAFELTRPEHKGRYDVTIYQMGWRLGGKGASGRGPAGRIEEHGLHVWLGFYENAFRLLRECYAELDRDPDQHPMATWRDAFLEDSQLGLADPVDNEWMLWTMLFPPGKGLPGDPVSKNNPFTLQNYLAHLVELLRQLLFGVESNEASRASNADLGLGPAPDEPLGSFRERLSGILRNGIRWTAAGLAQALAALEAAFRFLPQETEAVLSPFVESIASAIRRRLEIEIEKDPALRLRWEIVDLVQAIVVGTIRDGLLTNPSGLDSIDEYDCREWLLRHGASKRSVDGSFLRALYDLAMGYENGDPAKPSIAAGQGLRGCMRMFYSYRGSFFWKMRAGMGDVVFAPFYEVLKQRGVTFKFFHRLTNVGLSASRSDSAERHVETLTFDIQATIEGGREYQPLLDVKGLSCWPSGPDLDQLEGGSELRANPPDFESHWDRTKVGTTTLRVTEDFDFVVLGVSIGAIPYVCKEIVSSDERWRRMADNIKTVATQAFQIWLSTDLDELGWTRPPVTLSGFVKPFDTWADMTHLVPVEGWKQPPHALAYFCNALMDDDLGAVPEDRRYPDRRRKEVKQSAVQFLKTDIRHLWPNAMDRRGRFRWDFLCDPSGEPSSTKPATSEVTGSKKFDSQFWTANVNPSDRYVLALPGTLKYRISPLDRTYDNLTIAGDWTDCGFSQGCVESAIMSGRLAAHAISLSPALEDIVGYDHP